MDQVYVQAHNDATNIGGIRTFFNGTTPMVNGSGTGIRARQYIPSDMFNGVGGATSPVITFSTDIGTTDKVVIFRETRQDKSWVTPAGNSYADPDKFMDYFDQGKMICQELHELRAVASELQQPIVDGNANPFTSNFQSVTITGGTGAGGDRVIGHSTIPLITIEGSRDYDASINTEYGFISRGKIDSQLIVEYGDAGDGSSIGWTLVTCKAPGDNNAATTYQFNSADKTVTFGADQVKDIRIRRFTNRWRWWYDSANRRYTRGSKPAWNSRAIKQLQTQLKYMFEEAAWLPQFFADSPLNNPIFPRGWNWFNFSGTRDQWTIPGAPWGGDGSIVIYENDILQNEGTDYWIDWPNINWNGGEPTGNVNIGSGGGGWGGGDMGDEGDDFEGPINSDGASRSDPIDWPIIDQRLDPGISISVTSVPVGPLMGNSSAPGHGGWFGSNPWDSGANNTYIAIKATVTDAAKAANYLPDGSSWGSQWITGSYETLYATFKSKCPAGNGYPWISFRHINYDADSSGSLDGETKDTGTMGATSCSSDPYGAIPGSWSGLLINKLDYSKLNNAGLFKFSPGLQLLATMANGERYSDLSNIPFYSALQSLAQNAIDYGTSEEGIAASADGLFTDDQWEDYLNPGENFDDFDYTE